MTIISDGRVSPFGHPGIVACVPLPLAYRSLPRPSSPPCAQASPTCLHSLDYNNLWFKQSVLRSSNYKKQLSSEQSIEIDRLSIGLQEKLNLGLDVSRRATYGILSKLVVPLLLVYSVKEVIQPQVPLRLPCYDFAPVTALAFGRLVPCGF